MRTFFLLLFSLFVSGCVYWPTQYYKPAGTGDFSSGWGDYLKSQCGGPDNHVFFEVQDGLAISLLVNRDKNKDTKKVRLDVIYLIVRLGSEHRLRLGEDTVTVNSDSPSLSMQKVLSPFRFQLIHIEGEDPVELKKFEPLTEGKQAEKTLSTHTTPSGKIITTIKYSFSPSEEFRGGVIPSRQFSSFHKSILSEWQLYNWYRTSLDVKDIDLKRFYLRLPVLYFDGNPINIPDIEVELVDEFVRYPLMC